MRLTLLHLPDFLLAVLLPLAVACLELGLLSTLILLLLLFAFRQYLRVGDYYG